MNQAHSKTRLRTLLASLIALCVMAGAPTLAFSADDGDDGPSGATIVPTRAPKVKREALVRNKFFYKRGRLEIAPRFGYVVNNALNQEATFGLGVTYHFSERLGLEIAGDFAPLSGTANTKSLAKAVLRVLEDPDFRLESVDPLAFVTASLIWYPMYGKLTPFSSFVVNLDFFFLFGIGWSMEYVEMVGMRDFNQDHEAVVIPTAPEPNHLFVANFGFGAKWYLTRWLSFRIDGRLYVTWDNVIDFDSEESASHNGKLGEYANRLDCHEGADVDPICKVSFPTTWVVSGTLGFWAPGDKAARQSAGRRNR